MTVDEALADVEARAVCPLHEPEHVLAAEVRRLRGELVIALGPAPRPISGTMIEVSTPKRKETKP
jgi:hypothetical protein